MYFVTIVGLGVCFSSYNNSPKNNKPILVKRSNSMSSRGASSIDSHDNDELHSALKSDDGEHIGESREVRDTREKREREAACRPRHRHIGMG